MTNYMTHYEVEVTDTFGGESNYSWVRRKRILVASPTQRAVMRAAKKALGYSGVRGLVEDDGDMMTFRPYGQNIVIFITPMHVDFKESLS